MYSTDPQDFDHLSSTEDLQSTKEKHKPRFTTWFLIHFDYLIEHIL